MSSEDLWAKKKVHLCRTRASLRAFCECHCKNTLLSDKNIQQQRNRGGMKWQVASRDLFNTACALRCGLTDGLP